MPVTLSGYRVKAPINVSGRHNGVNVGILVSRLRDLGSRPGQYIVMCSWAKNLRSEPFSSQEYDKYLQIVWEAR